MEKEKEKVVRDAVEYIAYREPAALQRLAVAKQIQQAQLAGDLEQVRKLQMEYLKLVGLSAAETAVRPGTATQGDPSRKGGEGNGQEEGA